MLSRRLKPRLRAECLRHKSTFVDSCMCRFATILINHREAIPQGTHAGGFITSGDLHVGAVLTAGRLGTHAGGFITSGDLHVGTVLTAGRLGTYAGGFVTNGDPNLAAVSTARRRREGETYFSSPVGATKNSSTIATKSSGNLLSWPHDIASPRYAPCMPGNIARRPWGNSRYISTACSGRTTS